MKRVVLASLLLLVGCTGSAPSAELAAADSTSPPALLSFAADWSITQTGALVSGGKATVHYDVARLPKCRASYHGFPAWAILAYYTIDGGTLFSQPVTQFQNGTVVPVDFTLDVNPGHDLAIWFYASDEYGCTEWDSSFGNNYHFTLADGPPAVRFRFPGWSDDQVGTLRAGSDFLVDYDIRRLSTCRQDYNGYQTWDVTVGYRFDDGTTGSASLTKSLSDYQRVQSFARVAAPATASAVELWFEDHDRTGCQVWDSAYGANYRFAIVR
jgi:uncharacterized protein YraI